MIKRLFTALAVLFFVSPLFSELYRPYRFFEIGFDFDASISNNYFRPKDVLQKDLVIDLQKMNKRMPKAGFIIDVHSQQKFFLNANFSSRCRLGFFSGVEENVFFNLEKELFEILGKGISTGESKSINLNCYADVFVDSGFSFQTIISNFGVKVSPAFYVPILYTPQIKAKAKLTTSESGAISLKAEAPVSIYTAVDMEAFMDSKSPNDIEYDAAKIIKDGGFDLSFEVERNIVSGLNLSVAGRIPVIPAVMRSKASTTYTATFWETNALGVLSETEDHDSEFTHDDFTYSSCNYNVWRPFKLGVKASYRPFGNWFTSYATLGFAIRDLYRADRIFYPEYDFSAELMLKRLMGINFGTAYQNRAYEHYFGFRFNVRLIEIDAKVGLAGSDYLNSFQLSGAKGYIGTRIGF